MLQANQITKYYGAQTVLEGVSFVVNPGERVGLVGANGCGKSTLLRILTGEESPDRGVVSRAPSISLGYLPQGLDLSEEITIEEYIYSGIEGYNEARQKVKDLAAQLALEPDKADLLSAYGEALTRFEALGGYSLEHRVEMILSGLGLGNHTRSSLINPLSGGECTRLSLARLLLAEPSILLLDEPTNHLDIEALEWLEDFLQSYRGAVLVVSHDRVFLDRSVSRILELNANNHKVQEYPGDYSAYAAAKEKERARLWTIWRDQQAEIRRLEVDIHRTKEQALGVERSTINDQLRRYAKKVAKKAKSKEKRLQRYLESGERIEKPTTLEHIRLDFGIPMRGGQIVTRLEDIGYCFGERWLFREFDQTLVYGERVALVGPNGSGKTTLLRVIMGEQSPVQGKVTIGPSVRFGYMPQQQETLDPQATSLQIIQELAPMNESEVHHFLHFFLFQADDVRREVGKLSYGQRARLLLARLVASGANCLLLDEPINHLDIPSRQQFEEALLKFHGTVLIAVHDRAFIQRFSTSIWRVRDERIGKEYEL